MKSRCIVLAAIALLSASCGRSKDGVVRRPGEPDYIRVPEKDPEMAAAIAEARASMPASLTALKSPAANQSGFAVKKAFGTGDTTEHIWLAEPRFDGSAIHGVIANESVDVSGINLGDPSSVAPSEVSDWMYIQEGRLVGGFTLRVLYRRSTPEERQRLSQQSGFRME